MQDFINGLSNSFVKTFITEDRWIQLLQGLGTTLEITFFALLLGLALGFIIAVIRSTYDMNNKGKK
ncbi:MAG: amino acid ABC transporter permease, partial [Ruminococcus sp.]|nr:amino acid ABC transporter permease [Ruminococcus sp.]